MASNVHGDLKKLLTEISLREHIINPNFEYKYKTNKGDGYSGEINAVDINGTNKNVSVILKSAHANSELRKMMPIHDIYLQEIYFYDKIMPAYRKFQSDHNLESRFDSVAKCYATNCEDGKEILVLENLRNEGYDLWNRKRVMNREHVEFVFKEYAKFHGISIAMKRKNKALFDDLCGELHQEMLEDTMKKSGMIEMVVNMGKKLKMVFDPDTESEISEYYNNFVENIEMQYLEVFKYDEHAIITHGDCWCNNMMFKYENLKDISKPKSMRLIDFQIIRRGSPVNDLSYFLYVCAPKNILDDLDHYLKVYHQSLSMYLQQFGLNSDDEYPFSLLVEQWKKYARFGMITAFMILKVMLGDSEEVPDLGKSAEENKDLSKSFDFEMKNEEEYRRRAKDVIVHCYNNKYF